MIEDCKVIDLGFQGPKFTRSNSQPGLATIRERLDRALCNSRWRNNFQEAWVEHLARNRSDHCSLLIHMENDAVLGRIQRPFRNEAAWITHPGF